MSLMVGYSSTSPETSFVLKPLFFWLCIEHVMLECQLASDNAR